ncbi:bifunctional DNA primase/polymerase [Paracoccus spongiarum]|uniref:Bifunctional DNA primase/polymerase n=1 Tax=Paracoccus spongiarum TaxID=3064387 RepID=A0ABT9J982_9RHOB|nr:bifunctional DNA primase/polymerase [Paracoccus sp. 2205BS29-5]MDP5306384.1 bifunctional DNA primase/polymerase [Paracoccus sp. 2205BS29-5]
MSAFAKWQPEYAARGIVTFPVRDKRPCVKGYLKLGPKVSEQLAIRFADEAAFGFACSRNKITVLDVDAPDERLLADALDRHGPTPLIIRSGSGNFQAWYCHGGERRRVRPEPDKPIDILGDGFVVAPPSRSSKGRYEIIAGSLDDIANLPIMRASFAKEAYEALHPEVMNGRNQHSDRVGQLGQPSFADDQSAKTGQSARSIRRDAERGQRNDTLFREAMKQAKGCHRLEELMEKTMQANAQLTQPLPADEILKIVASAWGYECEGKNWFGVGGRVVFAAREVDDLAAQDPHAYALLGLLRRHHWGRDFILAKAYADELGWTLRRFKAARDELLQRNLIVCVHAGGRGPNDPPVYRFPE